MTGHGVRSGMFALLRAIGPEYWLLAFLAVTITNLIDFATVPSPDARPGAAFVAAIVVRVVLVFWANYALARRMAGIPRPLAPSVGAMRFMLFEIVLLGVYGGVAKLWSAMLDVRDQPLATQWLMMLALMVLWGVALIRLVGLAPAFAAGVPFRKTAGVVRASGGGWLALALGFVQVVLPFAAIHLALTLVGVRLPLTGAATAALALIDGIVSGVQLILTAALGIVAWRMPALRGEPPRG